MSAYISNQEIKSKKKLVAYLIQKATIVHCCFTCMGEQLKYMEMLLRNFLYSLEYCIAPRDQYILNIVVNNIHN